MIEEKYQQLCELPSDINEHLPTLKKYACLCNTILELGVRGMVSTWGLLAGHPLEMISVDIVDPAEHKGDIKETKEIAKEEGVMWGFVKMSSLEFKFKRTDLLFIDTIHSYDQLSQELKLCAPYTVKYIIMHDTVIPEMQRGIEEFLTGNMDWKVKEVFTNNNGLMILQRT